MATLSSLSQSQGTKDRYVLYSRAGKTGTAIVAAWIYDEKYIGYMTDPEFWKRIQARRNRRPILSLNVL